MLQDYLPPDCYLPLKVKGVTDHGCFSVGETGNVLIYRAGFLHCHLDNVTGHMLGTDNPGVGRADSILTESSSHIYISVPMTAGGRSVSPFNISAAWCHNGLLNDGRRQMSH